MVYVARTSNAVAVREIAEKYRIPYSTVETIIREYTNKLKTNAAYIDESGTLVLGRAVIDGLVSVSVIVDHDKGTIVGRSRLSDAYKASLSKLGEEIGLEFIENTVAESTQNLKDEAESY